MFQKNLNLFFYVSSNFKLDFLMFQELQAPRTILRYKILSAKAAIELRRRSAADSQDRRLRKRI